VRTWTKCLMLVSAVACGRSVKPIDEGDGGDGGGATAETGGASATSNAGGSAGSSGGKAGSPGKGGSFGKGGMSSASGGTGGTEALGGTAGAGNAPCLIHPSDLAGLSFDVEWTSETPDGLPNPSILHFALAEDGELAGELLAVFGSTGRAVGALPVARDGSRFGSSLWLDESFLVSTISSPGKNTSVEIGSIELCVVDETPRSLLAYGSLNGTTEHDDYYETWEGDFTLEGAIDETAPQWSFPDDLDPLSLPVLAVTEPLRTGGTTILDLEEAQVDLAPIQQAGTIVAFEVPSVLPLGIVVAPLSYATDLAGFGLYANERLLTTFPSPGIQQLDGFESALNVGVMTRVFDADDPALVGGADAIEGSQSLYVPAGLKVVFQLSRPEGAQQLSLDIQPVVEVLDYSGTIHVRAAVVGGQIVTAAQVTVDAPQSGFGAEAGAGGTGSAEPGLERIELPLTEIGPDVLLTIETPYLEASASAIMAGIVDRIQFQ
jgi:hypothetical protein